MLSRNAKAAFFRIFGPLMLLNGLVWRHLRTVRPGPGGLRLHLGPGKRSYLDGWVNIDANAFTGRCDLWADLRNPLPLRDAQADAVYSHHMVEHLPDPAAHFAEVFRVLKPGGVYRVGGPNGDNAARKFIEGDRDWFLDWPDNYRSTGGAFVNFIFCRNEHLTMLTASFLDELATDAGFAPATVYAPITGTGFPDLFADAMATEFEPHPECPQTLILEFVKPAQSSSSARSS